MIESHVGQDLLSLSFLFWDILGGGSTELWLEAPKFSRKGRWQRSWFIGSCKIVFYAKSRKALFSNWVQVVGPHIPLLLQLYVPKSKCILCNVFLNLMKRILFKKIPFIKMFIFWSSLVLFVWGLGALQGYSFKRKHLFAPQLNMLPKYLI